jgi:hypothetical protein
MYVCMHGDNGDDDDCENDDYDGDGVMRQVRI